MSDIKLTRLASGPDAGRLRVTVEVTLSEEEERACAIEFGAREFSLVQENLKLKPRSRGIGPMGRAVASRMHNAVADLITGGSMRLENLRNGPWIDSAKKGAS